MSLSEITEEFLAYVRTLDLARNMEEASAFLDVASVLVEAKSAALLPHDQADGERDEQSLEALRERDLLFARLLQYRAFKQAAGDFRARLAANAGSSRIRHMSMNVSRRCCRSLHGRWAQRTWRASPHRCLPRAGQRGVAASAACAACRPACNDCIAYPIWLLIILYLLNCCYVIQKIFKSFPLIRNFTPF